MKKEFLYAAISDAQELIRFTDNKTAIAITIVAAYIATLFSITENIVKYAPYLDTTFWVLLLITLGLILLCIVITARIIRPTTNPMHNIKNQTAVPDLKFFIAPNEYKGLSKIAYPFWNCKSYKLSESLEIFIQNMDSADDKIIEKVLSIEMLKVNYIRNIKSDRFAILFNVILATSGAFIIFFIHYSRQIVIIKNCIECCAKMSCH